MNIVGIDIGGTTIKADLYQSGGRSLNEFREVTTEIDFEKKTNQILEQVCQLIAFYQEQFELDGVAISSAGVVDSQAGKISYAGYTIPGYIGTDFRSRILKEFGLPIAIENDVNCAALGEAWLGAAKGHASAVMITVGTGIGGGIIYDGKIVNGSTYTAGEVGYLPMEDGQDWQSLASTTALLALYRQKTGQQGHTGRSFFAAIDQGDKLAQETLDIFLGRLAKGLLTLSYILNPEVLIIGGGILARSELILPRLESLMKQQVVDPRFLPRELVAAALGNEAGRLGAVRHFLNQEKNSV